jgi:transposase
VTKVDDDLIGQSVTIWLRWPDGTKVPCPVCGKLSPIYDRMPECSWRHLSAMLYRLELRCAVPRCNCEQDSVKTRSVPWAEPGSRFTLHFESFAVAVIAACRSLIQADELLGLHWDSVQRIIEQAVSRGLARRNLDWITRVGLDVLPGFR